MTSHNPKSSNKINNWFNTATKLHKAGQLDAAKEYYKKIINKLPKHADALHLLALIKAEQNQEDEALKLLNRAIDLKSNYAPYYHNRGLLNKRLGNLASAKFDFQKAMLLASNFVDPIVNLADILNDEGCYDRAIELYAKVLQQQPKHRNALNNMGNSYQSLEKFDKAGECYKQVLDLNQNCYEAQSNLGVVYYEQGETLKAINHYNAVLINHPDYAPAHANLGMALNKLHKYREAEEHHLKSIELKPDQASYYSNLGVNYKDQNQPEKALPLFKKALGLDPHDPKIRFNLALTQLVMGDFAQGWEHYEARHKLPSHLKYAFNFTRPKWQGESLEGKTLFIHVEQGIGDTLQFVRFLPLIKKQNVKIILSCQPELTTLFETLDCIDELISRQKPPDKFDYHIEIMGLAKVFKTDLNNIPFPEGYITAGKKPELNQVIKANNHKKIGFSWAGSKGHKNDYNRSINFAELAPILNLIRHEIDFYSLQYGDRNQELKSSAYRDKVIDLTENIKDFSDTAALIQDLDLVITVDSALAHLCGAMGKSCWVLLPFSPDFRWLLARNESPWYNSLLLYRQSEPGRWTDVIENVVKDLKAINE